MASKEQNAVASPRSQKTTPSSKEEETTAITPLAPSESQGLADLVNPIPDEPGRVAETLQRAQLDCSSELESKK